MKVGIVTRNDNFLYPIECELVERGHIIEKMHWSDNEAFNTVCISRMMQNCDVCFFDFVQYPLVEASHMLPKTCRIVARMHGIEVYYQAKHVNWNHVDHLVLSAPQQKRFEKLGVEPFPEATVLPIGTDLDFFTPPPGKQYGKKLLLVAATILPRKRVYTTIESVAGLLQDDPEFSLTIKGSSKTGFMDSIAYEYSLYIDELIEELDIRSQVFHIDAHLSAEDYRDMLRKHDYILSNSMQEGYHKVIADGVACGMLPVINHWPFCNEIWTEDWIVRSQMEMVERVLELNNSSQQDKTELAQDNRQWLASHEHDEKMTARQIVSILEGF